jgi:hypothetical protein
MKKLILGIAATFAFGAIKRKLAARNQTPPAA